jgi:hypothetical protein
MDDGFGRTDEGGRGAEDMIGIPSFFEIHSVHGQLTSAFAMNSMAVIVASDVAPSPAKRPLINLIDSSMCFLWTIISCNPKRADVHRMAWKSAASVMISGNHAESMTLLSVGSMAPASAHPNLSLALAIAMDMHLEGQRRWCVEEEKSESRGSVYI